MLSRGERLPNENEELSDKRCQNWDASKQEEGTYRQKPRKDGGDYDGTGNALVGLHDGVEGGEGSGIYFEKREGGRRKACAFFPFECA